MFERFTDGARRVVVLAQDEARLLNHSYIGTEHLLLGLLLEREGVAAKALESLGISLESVRSQVEEIIGRGDEESRPGHIPFTPRAKKVLELSLREALQRGHNYIGTEHILLGLIREGEGVAAQVVVKLGADLSRVRQRVVQLLGSTREGASPLELPQVGPPPARTPAANVVLAAADRLAGDAPVGSQHILSSLVQTEGSMAAEVLAALGIDRAAIDAKIAELRLEDTTDVTPEVAGARQMELRVDGDEVHIVLGDSATLERAKRIVELAGGEVNGDAPGARGFVDSWKNLQSWLTELEVALAPAEPAKENPIQRGRPRRGKPRKRQAG